MKKSVEDVLDSAEPRYERVAAHLRDGSDWFHEREGEMFERETAIENLSSALDVSTDVGGDVVRELVSDTVDPVVQIGTNGTKFVGIADFSEFDGAYGYLDYHDVIGERRRVICAQCVHDVEFDSEVTHATGGDPQGSYNVDASYDDLLSGIHSHYETAHNTVPEDVKTGASLVTGTTIGGNISFHAGNDGGGSGLDADKLDTLDSTDFAREFDGVQAPVYATKSDVSTGITKGEIVYVDGEGLYVEDGT